MGIETLAIVGLGLGLAGAGLQFMQGQKAAKAEKRARQEQRNQEENRIRRERMQVIREAQIKRALTLNFAEATGTGGSSSPNAAVSSLGSQAGTNIGAGTTFSASSNLISMFGQRAADARGKAAMFGSVGQLGFKLANFGLSGGFGGGAGSSPVVTGMSSGGGFGSYGNMPI